MSTQKPKYSSLKDIIQIIFIVVFFALLLKLIVIETLVVSSSSMEKTLLPGDFVLVNKLYYDVKLPIPFSSISSGTNYLNIFTISNPKKGDIIAFLFKNKDQKSKYTFIKRCIAVPGDSILFNDKTIVLPRKGDVLQIGSVIPEDISLLILRDRNDVEIKNNTVLIDNKMVYNYKFENDFYYFVGDNFSKSYDSRNFGPIPRKDIIGKVVLIYWSLEIDKMARSFFSKIRWNRLGMLVW